MQKEIAKLQLLVTEACNLRCDYCPIKKQPINMTWKVAKKAIDIHFKNYDPDLRYIVEFFGGEPMMNFDLVKKTIEYIKKIEKKYNFQITYRMVTNGTMVNKEFIEFMKKNPNFYIKLSCDGIKEAHDKHRKTANGKPTFHLVEKALKLFKKNNLFQGKKVQVGSVISPDTVKYIFKNYIFFTNFDIDLTYEYNIADNLKWTQKNWTEFEKQHNLIIKEERKKMLKEEKCRDIGILDMIKRFENNDFSHFVCQAARKHGMAVTPKGDIFICPYFESYLRDEKLNKFKNNYYLGNILEYENLDKTNWIKNKCKYKKIMESNIYKECKECKNKKYCFWTKCLGHNFSKHKDILQLNTNICQAFNRYLPPVLKFHNWLKENNLLEQYLESFEWKPE